MKTQQVYKLFNRNKQLLANFSYISVLQVFALLSPFLTYPYLTRVLGTQLYGVVITAQILASYAIIVVRFGFDGVSARHVSINREDREKLSEIMSSILFMRLVLWVSCFLIYLCVVWLIPIYREHFILFIFSYGLTINVLLFPQFFFQGVENMKLITYINIGIQALFIILIFIFIRNPSDYIYVPLLHSIGYLLGGSLSIFIIYRKYNLSFYIPSISQVKFYFTDALPLFATDAVCTIKDKLNYLLLGGFVGMSDVVVYDLSSKLMNLAIQPLTIVNTVIFPKMAKSPSNQLFYKMGLFVFILVSIMVLLVNIFLEPIVHIFIDEEVALMPIRIFMISPLFLGISSYIASSFIVARGFNKYMFYSIVITVLSYVILLISMLIMGKLDSLISFIMLAVLSYFVEMIYRLYITFKLI